MDLLVVAGFLKMPAALKLQKGLYFQLQIPSNPRHTNCLLNQKFPMEYGMNIGLDLMGNILLLIEMNYKGRPLPAIGQY